MVESRPSFELSPDALRRVTDPTKLPFQTTESLPTPAAIFGQARAREAIQLALEAPDGHYNLYVLGGPAAGGAEATLRLAREMAAQRLAQSDWVYVYNFETPEEPIALELPTSVGRRFAIDVEAHLIACRRELRRAFSSELYVSRRREMLANLNAQHERLEEALQREARALGFLVRGTTAIFAIDPLAPADEGAEPTLLTEESLAALSEEQRNQLRANHERVKAVLNRSAPQLHDIEEEARAQVRTLDRDVAMIAMRRHAEIIAGAYADFPEVLAYLRRLLDDMVSHVRTLRGPIQNSPSDIGDDDESDSSDQDAISQEFTGLPMDEDLAAPLTLRELLRRYGVNVMVTRPRGASAPVIEETNPTYANLVGRIDMGVRDNLQFTDHMMLKPGVMHKATSGFLILQAQDVLTQPRAWEAVRRVARFGLIELENSSQAGGGYPSATIRPQPIRADIKIILVGDARAFVLLAEQDSDFLQFFKVRADLDTEMPRNAENERGYAELAGEAARALNQPPLTSEAVALVIEEGSRWAEDQERLSARLDDVRDLCVEASHSARRAGDPLTRRQHVADAIQARERRAGLELEKEETAILEHRVLVSTDGGAVGQVNGLYVHELFGFTYGLPMRITATVSPGLAGVVTLDRESNLSGSQHTKGVLTLSGFLAGRFARDFPLSLSASLTVEQSYVGIDGDSASAGELFALLSALAETPIRQSLAVTGSVNQRGEMQAIGSVTAKVEGFFRICQQRGLTGEQGVIIPQVNARNLMLREEVVEAVRAGKFHVYDISTIEEGILLLTGLPFGAKTSDGQYLSGTVAARVLSRLSAYNELVRRYPSPYAAWGARG